MLKYIITGTGRCGTLFMANLFTSMGLPCTHEGFFTTAGPDGARDVIEGRAEPGNSRISDGARCLPIGDSRPVAESSYMAAPFLGQFDAEVIHVVRNPMRVVGSLTGGFFRQFAERQPSRYEDRPDHQQYERFIYECLPELGGDMGQIDRACLFYVLWNEMIERCERVRIRHRIEDDTEEVRRLVGFVGKSYYRNTSCNSIPDRRPWSVRDIGDRGIRGRLEDMAERYGYGLR
jgi:hypothetical protein